MAAAAPAQPRFTNGFVDGSDLVLLYRNAAGEMLSRRRRAEWSSFYQRASVTPDVLRDLRGSSYVVGLSEEGEWLRVKWQAPEWRRKAHEPDGWADSVSLRGFEADVTAERRFFQETGAQVVAPRRCYVDIETDSRVPPAVARRGKARVLCWSVAVDDEPDRDARDDAGIRILSACVLEEDSDEAERQLLEAFWAAVDPYDQLAAWFGDGFDFPILRGRATTLGARTKDFRRWLYVDQMVAHERMNRNAAESGEEKESLALDYVARSLGVGGKVEFDAGKTHEAWASGPEGRKKLLDYCCQDTRLLPKIERKTGYLRLNASLCEISQCFQETRNLYPIPLVDGLLLRMGRERGMRFPSVMRQEGPHVKFAGAFVLEPQVSGIRKHVHVFDFSGMYSSIMITWNLSPETRRGDVPVNGSYIPPGACRAPSTRAGFSTSPTGIVPASLKMIRAERKVWQKRCAELPAGTTDWYDANRRSNAYKVMQNMYYGAVGSPFCRFHDRVVAESTSTTGAWLIQKTLHAAEERGMFPILGDTDSGFVENASREEVAAFVKWCNEELYPKAVAECGCTENHVELAYEKEFERLIITSKKHYAGTFLHYKWSSTCECTKVGGDPGSIDVRTMTCRDCGKKWDALPPPRGAPEVKGLEYKRGDANVLARRMQKEVIDLICRERCEDPAGAVPIVERYRRHVLEDPLPVEEVRKAQAITKSLKEYKTATKSDGTQRADLAHVQVAKILKERGELIEEGVKIQFYVVDASVSPMVVAPAADYAGECDRYYLWENLIYPATQRVLEATFPAEKGMSADLLQMRDWARFAKARPKKERARKAELLDPAKRDPGPARARKASPAQASLFGPPPQAPGEPYVVEVDSRGPAGAPESVLVAVREALARFPGERPVVLRLATDAGSADVDVPLRVAVSPELVREVERAKGAA